MYVQVLQRPNNSPVDKLVQFILVSEDIVGYEVINAMLTMIAALLHFFKNLAAADTLRCQAYNLLMAARSLRL